jgi:hypothetical protein
MWHRTVRMFVAASFLSSIGAHLAVIQTVAWAKMAVSFSRQDSINKSLEKTFDGRHPCALCLKVKKASQQGASLVASPSENRLDGAFASSVPQLRRTDLSWDLVSARASADNFIPLLNSPPPKRILS